MQRTFRFQPIYILLFFFFVSCVPVSRISYVQSDDRGRRAEMVYHGIAADTRIRPGDELYVRINSADEERTSITSDAQGNIFNPSLLSYTVNEEGMIKLPYVGRILVMDLTIEEASDRIEETLSQYLYLPSVYVRFINTRVTVLGEVNRPGVYMFDHKNINILQAVGFAGDISEFGNRKRVLIIREEGAKRKKTYVDLTRASILESEHYMLKSGDIVFVEPLGRKKWGMSTVPYNLILTIISTGLFVYTVVSSN